MKLLVFSPYYPPHRGGLESHSDEFNKHLSSQGAHITVFTPRLPVSSLAQEVIHTTVKVIRYPAIEVIHNYPIPCFWRKEFWKLWSDIKKESFTVVLSRTRFFFPSLMAGYYAKKKRISWIHVEHGSDFAQFENSIKNLLGKMYDYTLGRLILKTADILVANSKASQIFVQNLSSRKDCHLIYRGIEKKLILEAKPALEFKSLYQENLLIGYIGRLIEGKGIKDLVQAFANSYEAHWKLVIIGDGPEKKNLTDLISELSLKENIILLGSLPLPMAMSHLKIFDIFVNPSYTEGIPTAVIEAALLQKAIVATNVGGTKEIISGRDDGILVQPKNIQGLGNALQKLGSNSSLRTHYGENAYRSVSQKFTWESALENYQELFRAIEP